ncbi:flavin reductase family protein [Catellatospora sp. NPDC049111]|uniref:flavin reductase family protein n=1 Tax=Catellatospora sp. NPDC049111 TaxID=3155271 RepID=UPI0033D96047
MTLTALPPTVSDDHLPDTAVAGVELHRYLGLLRRHATTVAVVTAPGQHGGPPVGFTATSFTSVSLRPQLVSFCLDRDSSSWPTVAQARHVAIHLLADGQEELARTFAARGVDRFADASLWRHGPYGTPLLHGVLALLICEVVQRIPAGDHAIVLGRPVSAEHRPGEPLLHHMGGYTALAH